MKEIQHKDDLAINGAEPAFIDALHVGRPNIGSKTEFLKYVDQIFDNQWLTNDGPLVQEFEQRIADSHGVKHCVVMCNGTIALEIAIRALGLEGEVIIPSYTFIATAHALHWQAITPVFADINSETHTLDPHAVRQMITPKTTGIIGVHLWGRTADVDGLQAIANEFNLKLMFDAAHAFGCSYKGKKIGGFGDCEVLSFHATKFINSFEGGAVLTNNDELADAMKLMRNFGFSGADNVIHPGTNGKMMEISAAMGLVNMDSVDEILQINRRNYDAYQDAFVDNTYIHLHPYDENESNNYQYIVIEIDDDCPATRDDILIALHAENILARRYFWPGCHKMKPYRDLYPHAGLLLPNTKRIADKVIVLPTGTAMSMENIEIVILVIQATINQRAKGY